MKKLIDISIGIVLLFLLAWNPYPFQILELKFFDGLMSTQEEIQNQTIVLVDVDEEIIKNVGGYPLPRSLYASLLERTNSIIRKNLKELNKFFNEYKNLFSWNEPDGGCIAYPKYLGSDGVENFCENLIKENSVLLLPSSVYLSVNKKGPKNHFRVGFGRKNMISSLRELEKFVNKNYSF